MIPQNECSEFIILAHMHYILFSTYWSTLAKHKEVFCCLTRVFCPENSPSLELPGLQSLVLLVAIHQLLFSKI